MFWSFIVPGTFTLQRNSAMVDVLLFIFGCCAGALANWAIYRLAIINPRPVSPWSRLAEKQRSIADLLPVIGWWRQRRLAEQFGRGFWIRPLLIELACGAGLVALRRGIAAGMLTASSNFALQPPSDSQSVLWLAFYSTLLIFLVAATFIDFDEKTIPDEITLTGSLVALAVAYFLCGSALPNVDMPPGGRPQINQLHFGSPMDWPQWHRRLWGLASSWTVLAIWMFALAPKRITWRFGLPQGIKFLWASMLRPARKSSAPLAAPRTMLGFTKFLIVLLIVLAALTFVAWSIGGLAWDRLFSALMGLAFGGALIWAVRIIAGYALGVEAMGFGDVTLMAMIGAWMGWQPALLVFVFAPFGAEIAFGPYLSLGALIVLIFWGSLWHDWAKFDIFGLLGPYLLVIGAICLVAMAVMLGIWRRIKDRWAQAE
jgi:prepilin signal peptidase PulO-like enzyme (type II secretory pathway)